MPEEILPYVKNIKASLLLGTVPERKAGWLGIKVEQGKNGVAIKSFEPSSPAMKSPLIAGDFIDAINGESIKTVEDFNKFMNKTRPRQTITIRYRRGNYENEIKVTLGERP